MHFYVCICTLYDFIYCTVRTGIYIYIDLGLFPPRSLKYKPSLVYGVHGSKEVPSPNFGQDGELNEFDLSCQFDWFKGRPGFLGIFPETHDPFKGSTGAPDQGLFSGGYPQKRHLCGWPQVVWLSLQLSYTARL